MEYGATLVWGGGIMWPKIDDARHFLRVARKFLYWGSIHDLLEFVRDGGEDGELLDNSPVAWLSAGKLLVTWEIYWKAHLLASNMIGLFKS